jgi:hypothetical protein
VTIVPLRRHPAEHDQDVPEEPGMDRQPVVSSLIRSVGYDLVGSILEIELIEPHRVYTFYDVPFSVYEELTEAPSKGTYFNEFIRDLYPYELADSSASPAESEAPDDLGASEEPK